MACLLAPEPTSDSSTTTAERRYTDPAKGRYDRFEGVPIKRPDADALDELPYAKNSYSN